MPQKLSIIFIALFVAVDVWLVSEAVQHVNAEPPGSDVPLAPVTSTPSSPSGTEKTVPTGPPAPTGTTPPSGSVAAERSDVLLAIASDGTILRARTGDCRGEPGRVRVSTDGGESFTTAYNDVPQVLRVVALSRADLWFVEANDKCNPAIRRSGDTGGSWARTARSLGAWHLSPRVDNTNVHAPSGAVDAGCVAVAIAPVAPTIAYIGCDDGTTRRTIYGGQIWTDVSTVDGLVGLTFANENTGFALATADCGAAVLTTVDAGQSWGETACLKAKKPKAIAANPDLSRIVVQAGGTLRFSQDGGITWQRAA